MLVLPNNDKKFIKSIKISDLSPYPDGVEEIPVPTNDNSDEDDSSAKMTLTPEEAEKMINDIIIH